MKALVTRVEGMKFLGRTEDGRTTVLHVKDAPDEVQEGPSPMEAILQAVGACTGSDLVWTLRKMRQPIDGLEILLEADRATDDPKVFTSIRIRYVVRGRVKEDALRRAIELSQSKYCSASILMQRAGVDVTTSYEIQSA